MPKTESPTAARERVLQTKIENIEKESGAKAIAVALHDAETGFELHYKADRWFHAASTIKVPILLGAFAAIDRGELLPHSRVHVRNRFLSVVENVPFRVESGRDANSAVHNAIGKMMRVDELAYHMITTSSNLATNLLLGVIGPDAVNRTLKELDVDDGIDLKRGVEDELAFEKGINNMVTADGLLRAPAPGPIAGREHRVQLLQQELLRNSVQPSSPGQQRIEIVAHQYCDRDANGDNEALSGTNAEHAARSRQRSPVATRCPYSTGEGSTPGFDALRTEGTGPPQLRRGSNRDQRHQHTDREPKARHVKPPLLNRGQSDTGKKCGGERSEKRCRAPTRNFW